VNDDADAIAVAGEGFVDAVVYDLVDQVMKTPDIGAADEHARTPANRIEPFEHLDVRRGVAVAGLRAVKWADRPTRKISGCQCYDLVKGCTWRVAGRGTLRRERAGSAGARPGTMLFRRF
jgi:hypothetical protein